MTYTLTTSLGMRYSGPHEVLHVINPVVYVAAVDGTLRYVHANKMKRESHNDDGVEVKIDRLRMSPFMIKPLAQQEKEKLQKGLGKYMEDTMLTKTQEGRLDDFEEETQEIDRLRIEQDKEQRIEVIEVIDEDNDNDNDKDNEGE